MRKKKVETEDAYSMDEGEGETGYLNAWKLIKWVGADAHGVGGTKT